MEYHFSKNNSTELKETRRKINQFIMDYKGNDGPYDTWLAEFLFSLLLFIVGMFVSYLFYKSGHNTIAVTTFTVFLGFTVILFYWPGSEYGSGGPLDEGIVGHLLNRSWKKENKAIYDAIPTLERISDQLKYIESRIKMSNQVEALHKKYNGKLQISVNWENGQYYDVLVTGRNSQKNTNFQLEEHDEVRFSLPEKDYSKTFKDNEVDFSWIDSKKDKLSKDVKQLFLKNEQLPELKITEI